MESCPQCGRKAEFNYSDTAGGVVCERCHCTAFARIHGPTKATKTQRLLPDPPRAHRTEWMQFRFDVIAWMEHDGVFHYIAHDRIAGRCPICGDTLGVHFKGHTPQADFVCHGGCNERDVYEMLGHAHDYLQR